MLTATQLPLIPASVAQLPPDQVPLPFPPAPPVLPVPVERDDTGELRDRAARFVQAVTEVIHGHRPARQLGPWMAPDVYEQLLTRLRNRPGPSRSRPRVASIHLAMSKPGVAEIAARVRHGGRSHALALRLDLDTGSPHGPLWRCTALTWA